MHLATEGSRMRGSNADGEPPQGQQRLTAPRAWVRVVDLAAVALYCLLVLATMRLAYTLPLVGDDYDGLGVLRGHAHFAAWVWFYYAGEYGRLPGIAAYYLVVQHRFLFAVLAGLTLPLMAILVLGVALGRLPTTARRDLYATGFLTVALWFSLPIQWVVFWRTGWPYAALPSLLMLAFVWPYRLWLERPEPDAPTQPRIGAALGMLALGSLAADSHESVLAALTALAVGFVWYASMKHAVRKIPLRLWMGVAGLGVGAVTLLAAPGNRVRAIKTGNLAMSLASHLSAIGVLLGRTFFVWVLPMYPWLAFIGLAAFTLTKGARPPTSLAPRRISWVWLLAAVVTGVPFLVFPQVTEAGGARIVIYGALFLFVAATAFLAPESSVHVIDRLPRLATTAVLAGLLVVTVADVGVNLRYAAVIDSELAARAQLVAQRKASGATSLLLPSLNVGGVGTTTPVRAMLWVDLGPDPHNWVNEDVASYYGVDSVATTAAPAP